MEKQEGKKEEEKGMGRRAGRNSGQGEEYMCIPVTFPSVASLRDVPPISGGKSLPQAFWAV
jgi:hypothetical protein